MQNGCQQAAGLKAAAAALIERLAQRAAYAAEDEYNELRSLMSAVRGFTEAADGR